MKPNEIICILVEATNNDKQAILDILNDGEALLSLGITDADIESVECAHDFIIHSKD